MRFPKCAICRATRHVAVRDLGINVPANAWSAGPPIEKLIGRWWLTGGDTDFR